jgi:hypothetical protein
MKIYEFFDGPVPTAYQDPAEDKSTLKIDDSRKTRLTLSQINRLRQMNDVRKFEHEKHLEKVSKQYKAPVEGGVGGLGSPASI